MNFEVTEQPETEPLTLGEVKNRLRIDYTADDTELSLVWIPVAREMIERRLSTSLVTQTLRGLLDAFPCGDLEIPWSPIQSVTHVKYYDEDNVLQTLNSARYQLDTASVPARIRMVAGDVWPPTYSKMRAVEVTFVAGDGEILDVRPTLRAAMLIQTQHLYEGGEGLHKTVELLLDLAWDGRRHGAQEV